MDHSELDARPKLLIVELWGLGDLVIATPFIRAAAEKFSVTLLAKPFAIEMRPQLWPTVEIVPFTAPWTAFFLADKYNFWRWPWRDVRRLRGELRARHFDYGVSARWDPRDHLLLRAIETRERIGFPRLGSERYLTQPLGRPHPLAHRSQNWRAVGAAIGLTVPAAAQVAKRPPARQPVILIHSGARLPLRVWPLKHFREIIWRLRQHDYQVQVACDEDQVAWWRGDGETVQAPRKVSQLLDCLNQASIFIGNDSGPGHLAAISGLPTFTLFGPQLYEWFAPMHPASEWFEGKACPYKPCSDYCRFPEPFCLWQVTPDDVWPRLLQFVERNLGRIEAGHVAP